MADNSKPIPWVAITEVSPCPKLRCHCGAEVRIEKLEGILFSAPDPLYQVVGLSKNNIGMVCCNTLRYCTPQEAIDHWLRSNPVVPPSPEDDIEHALRMKRVGPERLRSFTVGQRIRVVQPEHPMLGETGTVRKTRRPQDQAWVEMDRDLPGDLRTFPATDTRHERFTLLWPDECAEVPNA